MIRFNFRSLRLRLIVILSCAATLIWLFSTVVAWQQVRKEVNEVFDAQQILFAQRLASSDLKNILIERHRSRPHDNFRQKGTRKVDFDDDALAFAVFTPHGEMILNDGKNGEHFRFAPQKGFSHDRLMSDDSDPWRIFWLPTAEGRLVIAVGQELDYRDDLVEEMVLSQMWIWFAGLPLLLCLIIWLISRELKSVREVGELVASRKPDENQPLATNVPSEILPLVESLNQFFERTAGMLLRERRFTADAAHELRSPLAGLKVQAELAQLAGDDHTMRDQALQNLTQGINRATQLIEQLLTLSRLDNLQALEGVEQIDWAMLIRSQISERYFTAQKRQIELEFELLGTPTAQQGQPLLLSLLLRNLIDNAIHYCQPSSRVRISLSPHSVTIADNGGGVPPDALAKLGQRFYRPAGQNEKGSGLGLSIVHRIAELHHYQITLENRELDGKIGFWVQVAW